MDTGAPFQVIFLTGPPATGKSTLVLHLLARVTPLLSFTYSIQLGVPLYLLDSAAPTEELAEQISRRL